MQCTQLTCPLPLNRDAWHEAYCYQVQGCFSESFCRSPQARTPHLTTHMGPAGHASGFGGNLAQAVAPLARLTCPSSLVILATSGTVPVNSRRYLWKAGGMMAAEWQHNSQLTCTLKSSCAHTAVHHEVPGTQPTASGRSWQQNEGQPAHGQPAAPSAQSAVGSCSFAALSPPCSGYQKAASTRPE